MNDDDAKNAAILRAEAFGQMKATGRPAPEPCEPTEEELLCEIDRAQGILVDLPASRVTERMGWEGILDSAQDRLAQLRARKGSTP